MIYTERPFEQLTEIELSTAYVYVVVWLLLAIGGGWAIGLL